MIEDVLNYGMLKMLLECSSYDLKEWTELQTRNETIKNHFLKVSEEMEQAGNRGAVERVRASLKRDERTTGETISERVKFFKKEQVAIMERMQAAEEAILSLPDNLQETMWFLYIEGWEPDHVSQIMKCKPGVIEKRRQEGLEAIRDSSGNR